MVKKVQAQTPEESHIEFLRIVIFRLEREVKIWRSLATYLSAIGLGVTIAYLLKLIGAL